MELNHKHGWYTARRRGLRPQCSNISIDIFRKILDKMFRTLSRLAAAHSADPFISWNDYTDGRYRYNAVLLQPALNKHLSKWEHNHGRKK
jgi:hypothetical protein